MDSQYPQIVEFQIRTYTVDLPSQCRCLGFRPIGCNDPGYMRAVAVRKALPVSVVKRRDVGYAQERFDQVPIKRSSRIQVTLKVLDQAIACCFVQGLHIGSLPGNRNSRVQQFLDAEKIVSTNYAAVKLVSVFVQLRLAVLIQLCFYDL